MTDGDPERDGQPATDAEAAHRTTGSDGSAHDSAPAPGRNGDGHDPGPEPSGDGGGPAPASAAPGDHPLADVVDRPAATAGLVLAGVVLVAALLPWTDAAPLVPAGGAIGSVLGGVLATAALVAFTLRRQGLVDRRPAAAVAAAAGVLTVAAVLVRFVGPETGGGDPPTVGVGLPLAGVAGVAVVGLALADYHEVTARGLVERAVRPAVGFGLLVLVFVVASLVGALLSPVEFGLVASRAVSTVLFDAVLVAVTVAFLLVSGRGLAFVDVERPDLRDAMYAAVAFVGLFVGQVLLVAAVVGLGLPSSGNRIVEGSMENPELLLVLIPLQFLAVAPAEELFNRNLLQKYFYGAYSRPAAIVVASGVFASAHLFSYAGDSAAGTLVSMAAVLVLGTILGAAYERTENVLVPIVAHGLYNATLFALRYLAIVYGEVGEAAVALPW